MHGFKLNFRDDHLKNVDSVYQKIKGYFSNFIRV